MSDERCDFHSADPAKDKARVSTAFLERVRRGQQVTGWVLMEPLHGVTLSDTLLDNCVFAEALECDQWSRSTIVRCRFEGLVRVQSVASTRIRDTVFVRTFIVEGHFTENANDSCEFIDVQFEDAARFDKCLFSRSPVFRRVRFKKDAVFESVRIDNSLKFDECDFGPAASFAYTDVAKLIFRHCRMAGVALSQAHGVSEADYDANDWRINGQGTYHLYEERHALETNRVWDFMAAERAFREVRRSLEERRHFVEAGHFASRELEMRRLGRGAIDVIKGPAVSLRRWLRVNLASVEALYYHTSLYGDSITRPAVLLIVLVSASPFVLALAGTKLGGAFYGYGAPDLESALQSYVALFAYSLRMAALLNDPPQTELLPAAQIWIVLLRVMGPFFALLISLAVRRRLRR